MNDAMTFPDTVEEFMEQYKVVDNDHVYSNGIEFVPIFRMRQWFEHQPEITRCKDCKHQTVYHYIDERFKEPVRHIYGCDRFEVSLFLGCDEQFCSEGERKIKEVTK